MSGTDDQEDWAPEIDELRRREAMARELGGAEKVARQHAAGRLTVRERIDALLDSGTFHEVGALAGRAEYDGVELRRVQPSNFVTGRGRIDGRPVVVCGDDFTVRGGAADASIHHKLVLAEQTARELRLPLVRLLDGTGGGGSVRSLVDMGRTYVPWNPGWDHVVANLSTVPVVALALGPVAGLGAARLVTSHYSVLVRGIAQVFVAGLPLVAHLGEVVDKEALGGAAVHGDNGTVDDVVDSEEEAFARTRAFLSYLPASVHTVAERRSCDDPHDRRDQWLLSAVPRNRRRAFPIRPVIRRVVDTGSWFEIGRGWGRTAVTGLARLGGWPVAVLSSDSMVRGGGWTADAARKLERFVDLADTFHLPVVHLVDQPGFVIGVDAERASTIRHGARALAAIYQAKVPWCSVLIRRAFGVAGAAHQPHHRAVLRYAWPSGDWGSLPLEGGIEAAYRADLEVSDDPAALRASIEERMNAVRSPFRTAEAFLVEEVIDPRDTRRLLCEFAELAAPLRQVEPPARGSRP